MSATLALVLGFIESPDEYTIKVGEREVTFIDSFGLSCGSNGEWFIAGHEFGATVLIHANSYLDAWGEWIDHCPTIPEDEIPEAYGIDDAPEMEAWKTSHPSPPFHDSAAWDAWCKAKDAEADRILMQWEQDARDGIRKDYPELIEGYEYQSNTSGTGIVDVGHYSWMNEADLDEITIETKCGGK